MNKLLTSSTSTAPKTMSEQDMLVSNGSPIKNYHAIEDNNLTNRFREEAEAADDPNFQNERKKRRHQRRRMRCLSGSTVGGRRPTISGATAKKNRRRQLCGPTAPPRHVHCNDWKEMLELTRRRDEGERAAAEPIHGSDKDLAIYDTDVEELRAVEAKTSDSFPSIPTAIQQQAGREREVARMRYISGGSSMQCDWIEETFCKRECSHFIPSSRDSNKCGCGHYRIQHSKLAIDEAMDDHMSRKIMGKREIPKRWSIQSHTTLAPTDAYGTIEFQGAPHPFKAQYLRLGFDSDPADIMCLFEHVWQLEPPKLIITIHGGMTNFDLQPKLARVFRKGLLKAARTTGAWIFTSGINAGVVRQVAAALESAIPTSKMNNKIVSIGIAPWGLLKRREDFVGRDKIVLYHPQSFPPKSRFAVLNNRHSFFLLVDNGTVGRYGADIILRRRFESYIAEKQKLGGGARSVPVVCVVLEGGTCTIRTVLDYVTTIPKVPVVICDGSGRASDLLAFAHKYIQEDGNLPEGIRPQLLSLIEDVFFYDKHNAQCLVMDILSCVRQRNLITVFRLGETQKQDVDYAILTALLKGHNLSPAEQLGLALAWNRVDIARSDIFVMGQDWPKTALHNAMMEALIHNRVDFVRLLLENGVSMHDFLTIARLEELYNTDQGPPNTLYYIVRDVVKIRAGYRYKLPHIGMAIEKLMANGFRSHYTSSQFRHKYSEYRNKLKEMQRHSESANHQLQTVTSRDGVYHRTGSEFFSRGFFRALPASSSDTRIGEKYSDKTVAGPHPHQLPNPHQLANQHSLTTNSTSHATVNAISAGNRGLSNHILWRTAYRRECINPVVKQTRMSNNMLKTMITNNGKEGLNEAIEYATEADEKQGMDQQSCSANNPDFRYPFSDLLIWAVLTKRHEMALCMWQHGEEALAKALVACRLYKSLANEAAEDYLEVEVCEELKKYAEEFRQLSLELLDHCYKHDDAQTLQLLTYELSYWGQETCLSLAVIVNNKQFLAHPCCQILLADLWHGGLRIRSNSNLKVIIGILFPPSIFLLEFKSREELMLQPQTAAEHQNDINDLSSSSSESSSSSSSESETDDERNESDNNGERSAVADRRRTSHGSMQSLNFTSIFQSKRKRHRPSHFSSSVTAPGKDDIELGKQKNRESQPKELHGRRSTAISRKGRGEDEDGRRETKGVQALVAQSTLGAVVSSSAGSPSGGSPLLQHASFPGNKSPRPPPSPACTSPASLTIDGPLPVDTADQQHRSHEWPQKASRKTTTPQFTLGSIGENMAELSNVSSPRQMPRRTSVLTSDTHSPQHDLANEKAFTRNTEGRLTANGGHVPKGIPLPEGVTLNKKRQIKFRRKLYEFFVAPITTFWAWTLSFVVFLSVLTYVLLIKTPATPTWLEWYLFAYVVAFGLEISRKFCMSEPKKIREKFGYFFGNYWNFLTSLAVFGFIIGFAFRLHPSTSKNVGRIILAVDSVLWAMKLLDFLGVHPRFGPYITMAGKMIMNMSSIVVMLGISLLGFGLARQSIVYPNEEWDWLLLRNVFYKPYFMLYGEVYADEIDTCGDEAWDEHLDKNVSIANAWTHRDDRARELACVPGHWIPPILMTVFLLIANILLISMLIAIFNNIFESTNKISQQIWLFQRYRQVMEYEATPFLPPPFTPVYYLYMCFRYLNYRNWMCICFSPKFWRLLGTNCCCLCARTKRIQQQEEKNGAESTENGSKAGKAPLPNNAYDQRRNLGNGHSSANRKKAGFALFDFSLKLFLSEDQVEKLHDFEEECMEDFAREKEYQRNRTTEERLHRTCERTEMILLRVNDIGTKETMLKGNVRELESRLELMENRQAEVLECLQQIGATMPTLLQSMQSLRQQIIDESTNVPRLIYQRASEEKESQEVDAGIMSSASDSNLPKTDKEQSANRAELPGTRAKSVQSCANVGGSTSSMSTVYYPLKGSGGGSGSLQPRGRTRTSTIAGTDFPSHAEANINYDGVVSTSNFHKFGSLLSLMSPGTAKGTTIQSLQSKKSSASTRRRYRQNDEYTSITDTINIECEGVFAKTMAQTPPSFTFHQIESDADENDENGKEDGENASEEGQHYQKHHELGVEEGMQTEEEEEDEMEEEEEGEDDEDNVDEEEAGRVEDENGSEKSNFNPEINAQQRTRDRSSQKRKSKRHHQEMDIEFDEYTGGEGQGTCKNKMDEGIDVLEEFGQSLDVEGSSDFLRTGTPNSTLRRARASFVHQQNSLFKGYEEEVGRPSYELQEAKDPVEAASTKKGGKSETEKEQEGHV